MNKISLILRGFKYKFLLLILIMMGVSSLSQASSSIKAVEKEGKKPNVIWLVLEDISLDLGIYGADLVKTPNLDRLAKQGSYYTNAYATSPVCSPARSAFFTGMNQTIKANLRYRARIVAKYEMILITRN